MAIESFEKEWKTIKTNFEKATGKKKPSEKFLKVFDKNSGLTPAAAAFDKTVDADDKEAARKAAAALRKTGEAYEQVLGKAAAGETDKTVQAETRVMIGEIDLLLNGADDRVKTVGEIKPCSDLNAFARLMKNKINGPRVIEYAKKAYSTENVAFLLAMAKKDYSTKTYDTYVKAGAPSEINIDDKLRTRFSPASLAQAPWDQATDEILKLFNDNIVIKLNLAK